MPTRREALAAAVALPAAAAAMSATPALAGRVRQSLASWCYTARGDKWSVDKLCQVARDLGCTSVELVGPDQWPTLHQHGLTCAIAGNGWTRGPGFMSGFNNPAFRDELVATTTRTVELAAQAKVPAVIGFVGYKYATPDDPTTRPFTRDEAVRHCVAGLKLVAPVAEKHGVTLCVEHLNSRDASDPMKGHPGYQGDDLDLCAEILRAVGSPRVKLLFDIYHVQVMHGDLIRRIEQVKDLIGHVHTAGCPGRGELDDTQEVNYPAVIRKLLAVGYAGYVGHEFIPTRDPLAGLTQAVKACDV